MHASKASCALLSALTILSACNEGRVADPGAEVGNVSEASSLGLANGAAGDTLAIGDTVQLTANLRRHPNRAESTVWTSSAPSVASVSSTGLVTALSAGETMINASNGFRSDSARIVVKAATVVVASVVIAPDSTSVAVGDTTRLIATVLDSAGTVLYGRTVHWQVADTTIAVVSDGRVSAQKAGSTTLSAESDGKTGTAKLVVVLAPVSVASIVVSPTTANVSAGQKAQLVATVRDAQGGVLTDRTVTWTSSNQQIATVSATGLVSGVAPGSVSVTAASEGKTSSAQITVQSAVVGTAIYPGDDAQAAINKYTTGTTFVFKAGVHRLPRALAPKANNTFVGEPGAILSGARVLTSFTREGSYWVATGQTQEAPWRTGECDPSRPRCGYPEDLFFDDQPLIHVSSLSGVAAGKWYFDYAADKIYFADDPTGRKVETSVTTQAFYVGYGPSGVTIQGLIVEKFANPAQSGAIGAGTVNNWTVRDNEIRWNHGIGIALNAGSGFRILNNRVHHNGEMGLSGSGAIDMLVEGNEISYNNTAGYWWSWEGGGTKFVKTQNLIVRGNYSHHNEGIGLWTDYNNVNTLYENNRVEDNADNGIFHEIGCAAIIRNNIVQRNGFRSPARGDFRGGAGIITAGSPDVQIFGNTVIDNAHGIAAVQRAPDAARCGSGLIQNLYVHDNVISMSTGFTGLRTDVADNTVFTSRNNRFENNRYQLGGNARYFMWMNAQRTEAEWRGYGLDQNGGFSR